MNFTRKIRAPFRNGDRNSRTKGNATRPRVQGVDLRKGFNRSSNKPGHGRDAVEQEDGLRNEGTRLEMAEREEKRPCLEAASEGENWSKVPWLWRMGAWTALRGMRRSPKPCDRNIIHSRFKGGQSPKPPLRLKPTLSAKIWVFKVFNKWCEPSPLKYMLYFLLP